jgi:hydrogenase maturation protease
MSRVLIIGYGNTMRGDDGVGWFAARALSATGDMFNMKSIVCQQLTPELAKDISESECTIFIDASIGECPGAVLIHTLSYDCILLQSMSHDINPEALLLLSFELYASRPVAYMITVEGESFDYEEKLSPRVKEALPRVLNYVRMIAEEFTVSSRKMEIQGF